MTKDSTLRVAWPSNLDIKTIKEQPIEITGLSSKQRTEDLPSYGELSLQSLRRKRLTSQQGTKKKYIYQQHFIFYRFSKVISLLIYSLLGLESWYPFLVAKKTDKSLYLVSPLLPPPPAPIQQWNKHPLCEDYRPKSNCNLFPPTSISFPVVEHVSKPGVIAIGQLAMM